MLKTINIEELEDFVLNAITPAHIALSVLSEGGEIDSIHIEKAKNRLFEIKKYIGSLRND